MTVRLAESAGFCFGVDRAVNLVYELTKTGGCIKTLGPIIHNPQVVEDLAQKGVEIIDTPGQAHAGDRVVIRSHGVDAATEEALRQTGAEVVDATCPFVAKIHRIVRTASEEGKTVLIAGNPDHPEVQGIVGHCKGQCYVAQTPQELEKILKETGAGSVKNAILVAQTTFNTEIWGNFINSSKKLCTKLEFFDTICNATNQRQKEAIRLAQESDRMIVIGGRHSSNTHKLYEVCSRYCPTVLVETAGELKAVDLSGAERIGVTAGASTPAHIIKEVLQTMSEITSNENFAEMLEQNLSDDAKLYTGKRVKGVVIDIRPNEVVVDLGAKQTGFVAKDEMTDNSDQSLDQVVSKGDEINLIVLKVNDQEGTVACSKKRCDAQAGYEEIKKAFEEGAVLEGVITNVVKGGVLVLSHNTKVFIPASQVSVHRVEDLNTMLKKEVRFKILEINERRGRALGSIRAVLNEERKAKEEEFWKTVEVGKKYTGEVKSLTSYGAFVDLGGVDGMIHITELSWGKLKHPSEVVNVGDVVEVYVKDLDPERHRISLGYKKSEDNPWNIFMNQYHIGDVVKVKIVSFTNYGAFATIIPGIDGLIHISQIANQRVEKISDILTLGEEVDVKIIDINPESKRVSLSMRALLPETDQKIVRGSENDQDEEEA